MLVSATYKMSDVTTIQKDGVSDGLLATSDDNYSKGEPNRKDENTEETVAKINSNNTNDTYNACEGESGESGDGDMDEEVPTNTRRPSIQDHLKSAAQKTSSLFSWTVMTAKQKVIATQPHLTKLQEKSKLLAIKTKEKAKQAGEAINETVQITRERANSALSEENPKLVEILKLNK